MLVQKLMHLVMSSFLLLGALYPSVGFTSELHRELREVFQSILKAESSFNRIKEVIDLYQNEVNTRDQDGKTPFQIVVESSKGFSNFGPQVAQWLLDRGADPTLPSLVKIDSDHSSSIAELNALQSASLLGNHPILEFLLKGREHFIAAQDSSGRTLLHFAALGFANASCKNERQVKPSVVFAFHNTLRSLGSNLSVRKLKDLSGKTAFETLLSVCSDRSEMSTSTIQFLTQVNSSSNKITRLRLQMSIKEPADSKNNIPVYFRGELLPEEEKELSLRIWSSLLVPFQTAIWNTELELNSSNFFQINRRNLYLKVWSQLGTRLGKKLGALSFLGNALFFGAEKDTLLTLAIKHLHTDLIYVLSPFFRNLLTGLDRHPIEVLSKIPSEKHRYMLAYIYEGWVLESAESCVRDFAESHLDQAISDRNTQLIDLVVFLGKTLTSEQKARVESLGLVLKTSAYPKIPFGHKQQTESRDQELKVRFIQELNSYSAQVGGAQNSQVSFLPEMGRQGPSESTSLNDFQIHELWRHMSSYSNFQHKINIIGTFLKTFKRTTSALSREEISRTTNGLVFLFLTTETSDIPIGHLDLIVSALNKMLDLHFSSVGQLPVQSQSRILRKIVEDLEDDAISAEAEQKVMTLLVKLIDTEHFSNEESWEKLLSVLKKTLARGENSELGIAILHSILVYYPSAFDLISSSNNLQDLIVLKKPNGVSDEHETNEDIRNKRQLEEDASSALELLSKFSNTMAIRNASTLDSLVAWAKSNSYLKALAIQVLCNYSINAKKDGLLSAYDIENLLQELKATEFFASAKAELQNLIRKAIESIKNRELAEVETQPHKKKKTLSTQDNENQEGSVNTLSLQSYIVDIPDIDHTDQLIVLKNPISTHLRMSQSFLGLPVNLGQSVFSSSSSGAASILNEGAHVPEQQVTSIRFNIIEDQNEEKQRSSGKKKKTQLNNWNLETSYFKGTYYTRKDTLPDKDSPLTVVLAGRGTLAAIPPSSESQSDSARTVLLLTPEQFENDSSFVQMARFNIVDLCVINQLNYHGSILPEKDLGQVSARRHAAFELVDAINITTHASRKYFSVIDDNIQEIRINAPLDAQAGENPWISFYQTVVSHLENGVDQSGRQIQPLMLGLKERHPHLSPLPSSQWNIRRIGPDKEEGCNDYRHYRSGYGQKVFFFNFQRIQEETRALRNNLGFSVLFPPNVRLLQEDLFTQILLSRVYRYDRSSVEFSRFKGQSLAKSQAASEDGYIASHWLDLKSLRFQSERQKQSIEILQQLIRESIHVENGKLQKARSEEFTLSTSEELQRRASSSSFSMETEEGSFQLNESRLKKRAGSSSLDQKVKKQKELLSEIRFAELDDEDSFRNFRGSLQTSSEVLDNLWIHQRVALQKTAELEGNIGYLEMATGTGKTRIFSKQLQAGFSYLKGNIALILPTLVIKDQAFKEVEGLERFRDRVEVIEFDDKKNDDEELNQRIRHILPISSSQGDVSSSRLSLNQTVTQGNRIFVFCMASFDRFVQKRQGNLSDISLLVFDEMHLLNKDTKNIIQLARDTGKGMILGLSATPGNNKNLFKTEVTHFSIYDGIKAKILSPWETRRIAIEVTDEVDSWSDQLIETLQNQTMPESQTPLIQSSGIIYVSGITTVNGLTAKLKESGLAAQAYHSGINRNVLARTLDLFKKQQIKILVADGCLQEGLDSQVDWVFIAKSQKLSKDTVTQILGRALRKPSLNSAKKALLLTTSEIIEKDFPSFTPELDVFDDDRWNEEMKKFDLIEDELATLFQFPQQIVSAFVA